MRVDAEPRAQDDVVGLEIRVRGRVQGVGFRPTVWRFARELGLSGEVLNDSKGVLIRAAGPADAISRLVARLQSEPPPLARIEQVETRTLAIAPTGFFRIAQTVGGEAGTEVAPDSAVCPACAEEVLDPSRRRYRYPFANCTWCGPRLSIVTAIPYDRCATTMAAFAMCGACRAEYEDPADRRFHAEPIACPACGPKPRLVRLGGLEEPVGHAALEPVDAAGDLILQGRVVAIKGLGGYQLACDATDEQAVLRLRRMKRREAKPFALMARDLDVVRRYCGPGVEDERQLTSIEAPIVLMRATGPERLPDAVAPGLRSLGFMLPTTPLHLLLLRRIDRPVVMTSGNLSDEPQLIDDAEAAERLTGIADYALVHDRKIANRVDDSVVRVMGGTSRVLRRARGFAPAAITLPNGLEAAPDLLAMGGEVKATFCLVKNGQAVLSQHQGDLADAATYDAWHRDLTLYTGLFDHAPRALAADRHPDYLSSKLARERARDGGLPLIEVQHHHAHIAACLAECGRSLAAPPVLGVALDGLGWGDDGTVWGGEFLLADYHRAERLGTFKPVAMPGGDRAAREPWRNLYAHLTAEMGWPHFAMNFADLELYRYFAEKPRATLDTMIRKGINAPVASSCGRLFDAVAAALGICRDRQNYEGEAAARLESVVDEGSMRGESDDLAYPLMIPRLHGSGLPYVEPLAMWNAMLGDLIRGTPLPLMAARFHKGLARAIVAMAQKLAGREGGQRFDTVALSGGCFQNKVLFEAVVRGLEEGGFTVLSHRRVPANDGGLALGQAAIAAARLVDRDGP